MATTWVFMKEGDSVEMHGRVIESAVATANNRFEFWAHVVNGIEATLFVEIGVYRGEFAEHMLQNCETIETYFMVDPWRHLDNWNKPANKSDEEFDKIRMQAMKRTDFASQKRVVLKGRTSEISSELPSEALDFAYIDGDHTLRGITIDLCRVWPKIRNGGVLAGDDFVDSAWQHDMNFEPTMVFPMAVYFAEAVGATIYGLPYNQFAIIKNQSNGASFKFIDLTNLYKSTALSDVLAIGGSRFISGFSKHLIRKLKRLVLAK